MHTLIQTDEVTTEFYPKVHALNDGSFVLVYPPEEEDPPLVVERFLMEPTEAITGKDRFMFSEGDNGSFLIRVTTKMQLPKVWVYPTGAFNDGTGTNGFAFTEDTTAQVDLILTKHDIGWDSAELVATYDTGHNLVVMANSFGGLT